MWLCSSIFGYYAGAPQSGIALPCVTCITPHRRSETHELTRTNSTRQTREPILGNQMNESRRSRFLRWPARATRPIWAALFAAAACSADAPAPVAPEATPPTADPNTPPAETPVAATVTVATGSTVVNPDAQRLLGVTFEGRTSTRLGATGATPAGLYDDATGNLYPGVAAMWNSLPLTGMRYPGNAVNVRWDWKGTVGPVNLRPLQQLSGGAPAQRVVFGFDEYMAMAAARGVAAADIQIMIVIYPTASAPDPAAAAADWVEYANAPNDGSNVRGGTDWAAMRAANGHPAPYGIRIWNIGNEPWSPSEYNFVAAPYIVQALPIIDAMLQADPTLRITIPALGTASSPWNAGILASSAITSRAWGLSPHFFYTDDGSSGTIAQSEAGLTAVVQQATAKGLSVVIGDHAHAIPNQNTTATIDLAMQWQGALTTASFLTMASQVANVNRANFWIFGMPSAVWHPFRVNADGSYTKMALAMLYELLQPVMLTQSLATTVAETSAGALRVRASSFRSADGKRINVVIVNSDRTADQVANVATPAGFALVRTRLVTATALNADTFDTATATPLAGGRWALPKASVLLLEFAAP